MKPFVQTIFEFLETDRYAAGYFELAQQTFFEEVLEEVQDLTSLEDLKSKFNADQFGIFYVCMLEYFFSNLYPHPMMTEFWNILNEMQKAHKFDKINIPFINAFKASSVSLYKVSHNTKNNKIILTNLMEKELLEVENNEAMRDYIDYTIYARPLKIQNRVVLTDGRFIYPEEIVDSRNELLTMHNQLLKRYKKMPAAEFLKNFKSPNRETAAYVLKKVWSKELLVKHVLYLLEMQDTRAAFNTLH